MLLLLNLFVYAFDLTLSQAHSARFCHFLLESVQSDNGE